MKILKYYSETFTPYEKKGLSLCSDVADEMKIKIYLVGGIVRDILLKRKFNDIDILVEDDAIIFSEYLEKKYSPEIKILAKNEKFRTAKLEFNIEGHIYKADCASTRSEYYEYPSALPILAQTNVPLGKDISRRDFTINTLAMSLNHNDFCEIYDKTNLGLEDLERGIIRILHPDSFMDDPSRIVRGLKYRARLNFNLDEDTKLLQEQCLNSQKFDNDCQERIKKEVIETLNLFYPTVFDKFISENIYKLIINEVAIKNIPSGNLICEIIKTNINKFNPQNIWLIFLCIIFNFSHINLVSEISKKLCLKKQEQNIINDFFLIKSNIELLKNTKTNYEIFSFFQKFSSEAIIATQIILKDYENYEKIALYFNKLFNAKLTVSGMDINQLNIPQGSVYKEILQKTLEAKLNNNLNEKEEKEFFKEYCKKVIGN